MGASGTFVGSMSFTSVALIGCIGARTGVSGGTAMGSVGSGRVTTAPSAGTLRGKIRCRSSPICIACADLASALTSACSIVSLTLRTWAVLSTSASWIVGSPAGMTRLTVMLLASGISRRCRIGVMAVFVDFTPCAMTSV